MLRPGPAVPIDEVESQYKKGIITSGERYNKIIDIWTGATDRIAKAVFAKLENNDGKVEVCATIEQIRTSGTATEGGST